LSSFLITFLSPEIAAYVNMYVHFSFSWITVSDIMLGMVVLVWTCWFHNTVALLQWLVYTDFGSGSYHCSFLILHVFPWIWWSVVEHTLYHVSLYVVLLPKLRWAFVMWFIVSSYIETRLRRPRLRKFPA
jgi:hypothetical protein